MSSSTFVLLALLLLTQFLVVLLDVDVILALPDIQRELGFSAVDLQWVQTAYMIGFGGFLLLAGRAADLFGRRRMLVAGLGLFTLASLGCGLAPSAFTLVLARAAQGFGSALAAAAALSIITVTFPRGAARERALGLVGLMSGFAATSGLLLGGVATEVLGWRWVFLILVPVSAATTLATQRVVPAYPGRPADGGLDVAGAVAASAAVALLVLGVAESGDAGWLALQTLGPLAGALALVALFVIRERHAAAPILPLRVLRLRNVVGGNAATLVFGAVMLGTLALMSVFLQEGRGLSAIECGLWMLPTGLGSLLLSVGASRLVGLIGFRAVLALGMALLAAGAAALAAVGDRSLWLAFLPAAIIFGCGIALSEVSSVITSSEDLGHGSEAGLSSGLWSTSTQVGGAVGLGAMATVMAAGADVVDGFASAMLVAVGIGILGLLVVLAIVRDPRRAPALSG